MVINQWEEKNIAGIIAATDKDFKLYKPIGKELEAILEKLSSKATLMISPKTALIDSKSTKIKRVKNNKILKHE